MAHIGILGDYNPQSETHIATDRSLELAASRLGLDVQTKWIPTREILKKGLEAFNAIIVNTGVYEDRDAVLYALQTARERGIPTLAACGGFQHMIIEYAKNKLKIAGVGHAEFDPHAPNHIIIPLQCSLRGLEGGISILRDSEVGRIYQLDKATEKFYCSFGINTDYLETLQQSDLRIVGTDEHGLVRVTELSGHPFFIGTLFVPHARALKGESHPLVEGLVQAASSSSFA